VAPVPDACGPVGRCHAVFPHSPDGGTTLGHWPDGRPHVVAPFRRTTSMPRPTPRLPSTWRPSNHLHTLWLPITPLRSSRVRAPSRHHPAIGTPSVSSLLRSTRYRPSTPESSPSTTKAYTLFIFLAVLPACWSTSSSGRRRAATAELVCPRDPRANQPSQGLH
jgi:hypothetical protein